MNMQKMDNEMSRNNFILPNAFLSAKLMDSSLSLTLFIPSKMTLLLEFTVNYCVLFALFKPQYNFRIINNKPTKM